MATLKLIAVNAAYGDTLLLQTPDTPPKYWLIDGGPVSHSGAAVPGPNQHKSFAYYQFLKRALIRFCKDKGRLITLSGIILSHPDLDHVAGRVPIPLHFFSNVLNFIHAGLMQLVTDWLPDLGNAPDDDHPLNLLGPVILNATCFKRPPRTSKPDYEREYHHEFAKILAGKGFSPTTIPNNQNHNFFPASMTNTSLVDCYAMNVTPNVPGSFERPPRPWRADDARAVPGLDSSGVNRRSILTMWTDPPGQELSLVTTGDAMALDILPKMIEVQQNPNVGIFKVPHHGSQYNSQSEENPIRNTFLDKEKNHIFLLAMLVDNYFYQNKAKIDPELQAVRDGNLGEPRDEWNAVKEINVAFLDMLREASKAICLYLQGHKFRVTRPAIIDLSTQDGLQDLAKKLAERERTKMKLLLESFDGKVAAEPSLIDNIESETELGDKRSKFNLTKVFNLKKSDNMLKWLPELRNALFANEINSLHTAKFIANFYRSFTARNYVISASGKHGHPHAATVAGIMAACLMISADTMKGQPQSPARIFVTSGYSVQLDYVRNIVKLIVSTVNPPPTPPEWAGWIKVFAMNDDYVMPIPVDDSAVPGTVEIQFPATGRPQETELTMLRNQLQLAKAYDVPRAVLSNRSTFHLLVLTDPQISGSERYLTINAANELELLPAANPARPLFLIEHMGYRRVANQPNPALNPVPPDAIFKIRLSNANQALPDVIKFSSLKIYPPIFSISTLGPNPTVLRYDEHHIPPLWFDATPTNTKAHVKTRRVDELP